MCKMNEFIEELKAEVRNYLPEEAKDVIIDDVTVVKMNDQKFHGLTFRKPGCDAAPTIYVDDMYSVYKTGTGITNLARDLADMYTNTGSIPTPPEVKLTYGAVSRKLTVRLLEKKRNKEFLANMPYVSIGHGLAIIADINMGHGRDGDWRISVNNSVLASLEVDKETLFEQALKNSAVIEPATLVDMSQALFSPEKFNLLDRDEPIAPYDLGGMYVLTNTSGSLGAAALFYPGVKEKAAQILDCDYFVLPSSIHEVILVPDTGETNAEDLCKMVREANSSVVDEPDILSDNVFHFSKDAGFEKIGSSKEAA